MRKGALKLCSVGNMGHHTYCGHSHDDLMSWDVCMMAGNILADIHHPPQRGGRGNSGNNLVTWGVLWKCSYLNRETVLTDESSVCDLNV